MGVGTREACNVALTCVELGLLTSAGPAAYILFHIGSLGPHGQFRYKVTIGLNLMVKQGM